jgi:hypothetical protein
MELTLVGLQNSGKTTLVNVIAVSALASNTTDGSFLTTKRKEKSGRSNSFSFFLPNKAKKRENKHSLTLPINLLVFQPPPFRQNSNGCSDERQEREEREHAHCILQGRGSMEQRRLLGNNRLQLLWNLSSFWCLMRATACFGVCLGWWCFSKHKQGRIDTSSLLLPHTFGPLFFLFLFVNSFFFFAVAHTRTREDARTHTQRTFC